MSLHALTWAIYGDHPTLDPTARMILVVLADHAGPEFIAWPSRATIARAAGCSTDTVDRRMTELIAAGLIRPATDAECPAAWASWRPDRRPKAYALNVHGAAPVPTRTGPQSAAPSTERGRNTPTTGPQHADHGAATVRNEPKEPERTIAREADAAVPAPAHAALAAVATRVCHSCKCLHAADETCLAAVARHREAGAAAARGMTTIRAAMRERANA